MALAYTLTGLQTQLSLVGAAIDGGDYPLARAELAKAHLILIGLPQSAATEGAVVTMRNDVDKLVALLSQTQTAVAAGGDRRRLIRTGLAHRG